MCCSSLQNKAFGFTIGRHQICAAGLALNGLYIAILSPLPVLDYAEAHWTGRLKLLIAGPLFRPKASRIHIGRQRSKLTLDLFEF